MDKKWWLTSVFFFSIQPNNLCFNSVWISVNQNFEFVFLHRSPWTHRYNRIFASYIYLPWLSGGFPGWVEVIRGGGRRMIRWGVHLWRGIPCPQWNGCWVQVSPSQLILVTYHPHTINIVPDNEIICWSSNIFISRKIFLRLQIFWGNIWNGSMAAAQVAKKLKDKRQKNYIEGIFKKVRRYMTQHKKRIF